MKLSLSRPWVLVYDDAADEAAKKAAADEAAKKAAEEFDAEGNRVFKDGRLTQQQFNHEMAQERKKFKERTEKTIGELETLKKAKGLSDADKEKLQAQIGELEQTILTKQQLLEQEKRRFENEHKTAIDTVSKEKDQWKSRYERATIERAILDAAVANDAYNPSQFVGQLGIDARLVEEDGKFIPKIKFKDTDKDGNPVVLDLTPVEVVKRMKELPESYGNFFKANVNGGLGGKQPGQAVKGVDPSKMTPDEYAAWRKKNPKLEMNKTS